MTECDRAKKRHPEQCDNDYLYAVDCECGRTFRRCTNHGGFDGALRSRTSHRALGCAAHEDAKTRAMAELRGNE